MDINAYNHEIISSIKKDVFEFVYLDEDLKNDKNFIFWLNENLPSDTFKILSDYLPIDFYSDDDIANLFFVIPHFSQVKYFNAKYITNKQFVLNSLKTNPLLYKFLGDDLKNDIDIILTAIHKSPLIILHIPPEYKNDINNVVLCIKSNPYSFPYFEQFEDDKTLLELAKSYGFDERFFKDKSFILHYKITENNLMDVYNSMHSSLFNDIDIIDLFLKKSKSSLLHKESRSPEWIKNILSKSYKSDIEPFKLYLKSKETEKNLTQSLTDIDFKNKTFKI